MNIRPSEEVITNLSRLEPLHTQMPNILKDWEEQWAEVQEPSTPYPQSFIDSLFSAFVSGIVAVINPRSHFNKDWIGTWMKEWLGDGT
jgi:hypothetical protein